MRDRRHVHGALRGGRPPAARGGESPGSGVRGSRRCAEQPVGPRRGRRHGRRRSHAPGSTPSSSAAVTASSSIWRANARGGLDRGRLRTPGSRLRDPLLAVREPDVHGREATLRAGWTPRSSSTSSRRSSWRRRRSSRGTRRGSSSTGARRSDRAPNGGGTTGRARHRARGRQRHASCRRACTSGAPRVGRSRCSSSSADENGTWEALVRPSRRLRRRAGRAGASPGAAW